MSGCQRQCDWDDNDVCRTCGIDYSPPKPPEKTENEEATGPQNSENKLRSFHLAFPVDDLPAAKKFYTEVLGCSTGREKEELCVFNFYGHQIVAHRVPKMPDLSTNPVDGKAVPAMHFGLVLEWDEWHQFKAKLEAEGVELVIGPYTRYEGQPGSQATMFIQDPCGNHLEFKSFEDDSAIFDSKWY